jgi:hypothetical protein
MGTVEAALTSGREVAEGILYSLLLLLLTRHADMHRHDGFVFE